MRLVPKTFVLTSPEAWQFRKSRLLNNTQLEVLLQICKLNEKVRYCFLLDARQNDGEEVKIVIAVALDEGTKYFAQVGAQIQDAISEFPDIAAKTAIMTATAFETQFAGSEFYVR